jgi:hypothetical protein
MSTELRNGLLVDGMYITGARVYSGNTYWAIKSTDLSYGSFYDDHYDEYPDGSHSVYNTIQECVDACVSKRGDVVYVVDGTYSGGTSTKWAEEVVVDKDNVKIISLGLGWENQMRPGDATVKWALTPTGGSAAGGFGFYVVARGVEINGFLIDGGGGYSGIYIGDGYNINAAHPTWNSTYAYPTNANSASAWIHDCEFRGGSEGIYGIVMDGASASCIIENNRFDRWTVAGMYLLAGGSRTTQYPIIRNNVFYAGNAAYGISIKGDATTIGTLIATNIFHDGASLVFTQAINVAAGATGVTSIVNNNFACANKVSALATDYASGNTTSNAGNAMTYVAVA